VTQEEESDEAESDEEEEGLRRQYFDEGNMSDLDDFVDLDTDYEVHRQAREADAVLAVEAAFDAQNEALHLSIVNPSDEGFSIISNGAGMDGWVRP
jgi:hypothetical protein